MPIKSLTEPCNTDTDVTIEIQRQFLENVQSEHDSFKQSMLQNNPETVYDSFDSIYFYENIFTYLENCKSINPDFIIKMHTRTDIISALHETYYRTNFQVSEWNDISEMIDYHMQETNTDIP